MLRRAVLLGILACCLGLVTGCVIVQPKPDGTWSLSLLPPSSPTTITGGSGTTSNAAATTQANSAGKGASGSPSYPGKTLQSGSWTVVVENTEFVKRLEDGSRPSAGKRFLVVNVAIRNTGNDAALIVLPNEFALWGPGNKSVAPFHTKLGIYNAQSVRPVDAALGGYTSFVYELPDDSSIYTFTLTPAHYASGPMSWYVP